MKLLSFIFCINIFLAIPIIAQTHTSVSLDSQVYYILEQAELRGLCTPLPGVRPYTQSVVVSTINEILYSESAGRLRETEREILRQYLGKFAKPEQGINWQRGLYHNETAIGNSDTMFTFSAGGYLHMEGSAGLYPSLGERYFGTEVWLNFYLNGSIGNNVSWLFSGEGGLIQAPIKFLGTYNTYYDGFVDDGEFQNQIIDINNEPLTHFPYSYKKRWDGSVFFFDSLSSFQYWPNSVAGGYNLTDEITASFFDNRLIVRLGRIPREWGSMLFGSSLALNQTARSFSAMEADFRPLSWFGISTMTGILEYSNTSGIKESAMLNQNAFSVTMLQFRYKNYLFFDFIDTVIYPKRFELGYLSPITSTFFYQNNIGDFDNLAIILNLRAQYPGLGNVWFSLFVDEMNIAVGLSEFFELDRTMIAYQAGMNFHLPALSFSSLTLSYTKINPYCYTHNRNYNPWYGDLPMETLYTNNGVNLGYYLPPNSDEILLKFKTMPARNLITSLQYQMIRHGADFGSAAVDGSNLLSELDPRDRNTNPILRRYFLRDGAYQWMHIFRINAEWNLSRLPVAFFGEAGIHYSYFTNTVGHDANSGSPYPYSKINTSEYPESTSFIVRLGVKVFPR